MSRDIVTINGLDVERIDGRVVCSISGEKCGGNLYSPEGTCDEIPFEDCIREMSKLNVTIGNKKNKTTPRVYKVEDNPEQVPCKHAGCFAHQSHPCEVCGRISGRYALYEISDVVKLYKNVEELNIHIKQKECLAEQFYEKYEKMKEELKLAKSMLDNTEDDSEPEDRVEQ